MFNSNTQQKLYTYIRNFCFWLGFFSIGSSIYLWLSSDIFFDVYLLKLHREHLSIWIGLWCPTLFSISLFFDNMIEKLKINNK